MNIPQQGCLFFFKISSTIYFCYVQSQYCAVYFYIYTIAAVFALKYWHTFIITLEMKNHEKSRFFKSLSCLLYTGNFILRLISFQRKKKLFIIQFSKRKIYKENHFVQTIHELLPGQITVELLWCNKMISMLDHRLFGRFLHTIFRIT